MRQTVLHDENSDIENARDGNGCRHWSRYMTDKKGNDAIAAPASFGIFIKTQLFEVGQVTLVIFRWRHARLTKPLALAISIKYKISFRMVYRMMQFTAI